MNQTELDYKKTNGLTPFAYALADEWLYFCDQHIPGLFRYHFETEKCECVAKFNRNYINRNFYKIISHKNELWLLPFLDGKIVCFNMSTNEVTYYDIPKRIEENTIPFIDMVFGEENAYILPHGNNRFLVKVDLLTHDMQEIQLLEKKQEDEQIFFNGVAQFQEQVYLTESSQNMFVLFDICSKEVRILKNNHHPLENLWPRGMGRKIYLFPITIDGNEKLLIYDIDGDSFAEEEYPIKDLPKEEVCITMIFDERIWILANKQKKIYQIDQNLKIESEIKILNFNEEKEVVYVSGSGFKDCLFWNGHKGTPLIQVKDSFIQILDVCKDKNMLEIFIDTVDKEQICKNKPEGLTVGKLIYENIIAAR